MKKDFRKGYVDWEIVGISIFLLLLIGVLAFFLLFRWDYNTGRDTGYISAVDKMTLTSDRKIYLRRRPLDSVISTEKEETVYCTTADREEVIEKAYEAMESGKRVMLIYDEPRPFGFIKFGGCNSTPVTDIKIIGGEE